MSRQKSAKRKVVQVVAMPGLVVRGWFRDRVVAAPALYVLCSDGSIWAVGPESKQWEPVGTRTIRDAVVDLATVYASSGMASWMAAKAPVTTSTARAEKQAKKRGSRRGGR